MTRIDPEIHSFSLRYSMLAYLFLLLPYQQTDVTVLKQVFLKNDRAGFAELLPKATRVTVKLTPLLFDTGHLQAQQVLLAFDKLQHRYQIHDIHTISSQSDTNYAWLEIYLKVMLEDRDSKQIYNSTFAYHFKIIDGHLALTRWVLQVSQ